MVHKKVILNNFPQMPWWTKSHADKRFTNFIKQSNHTLHTESLQQSAAALLSKWIRLLWTEANQETILLFVLIYVFHYIHHCLRHTNTFNSSFSPQLLGNLPLLLQVGNHHVHNSSIWQAYCKGVVIKRYNTIRGRNRGHLVLLQMLYKALMQEQESGSLDTQNKFTCQEIPTVLHATPNK